MPTSYCANALIGVQLELKNYLHTEAYDILGTSIAIPFEDDEAIEIAINLPDKTGIMKVYDSGEVGGHLYYGFLIDSDEDGFGAPRGVPLVDISMATKAVKHGLKGLGYEGEVKMFCFLSCY
jgi:hypothetical protein